MKKHNEADLKVLWDLLISYGPGYIPLDLIQVAEQENVKDHLRHMWE